MADSLIMKRPKMAKYTLGKGFYENGIKHCNECHKFVYTTDTRCSDCGNRLRTKPHSSSGRRRLLAVNPPSRY